MNGFQKILLWLSVAVALFFCLFWQFDFQREGVTVAVLDTGVDASHPLLKGRVLPGYDFIRFRTQASDPNGHGTHVAGIIAQIAPEANILPVRVIDDNNQVHRTWLAVLYATIKGADVINMSYAEKYNFATHIAIRLAQSKGVVFVASSGNLGVDDVFYPAKYEGVYSVAGWDDQHSRIFGNYGKRVNYVAPGLRIRSAATDGGYAIKSGTSMSAGYLSGVIAFLKTELSDSLLHSGESLEHRLNEIAFTVNDKMEIARDNGKASLQYKVIHLSGISEDAMKNWEKMQSIADSSPIAMK